MGGRRLPLVEAYSAAIAVYARSPMKPAAASSITLPSADRSRSLPRETLDFLHNKGSIRAVHSQQVLRFAVLYDRAVSQDEDPIEIS